MNNSQARNEIERRYHTHGTIGHDDPNAAEKLRAKLAKLQELQELYKAINKVIRSKAEDKLTKLCELELTNEIAYGLLKPDHAGRVGIPSFELTNNNQNMKAIGDRLAKLQRVETMPEYEETKNGVTVRIDKALNRIVVEFPSKPEYKVTDHLKHSGFRWAPSKGAWLGNIATYRLNDAKKVFDMVPQIDPVPSEEQDMTADEMISLLTTENS